MPPELDPLPVVDDVPREPVAPPPSPLPEAPAATLERRPTAIFGERRPAQLVFALALAIFVYGQYAISVSHLRLSGDEPHELMTVLSIVRDGDLNVYDNYQRGDYRALGHTRLEPQVPAVGEFIPPEKGIGFPAFLVPIYEVAGVLGCRLVIAGLAACVLPLLYWICLGSGLRRLGASLACLGLAVCLPWQIHANLVLPEVLAGLIVMVIAAAFLRFEQTRQRRYAFLIGFCTLVLPVLYLKFTALAAASGVLWVYSAKLRRDWLVYASAPLLLAYAALWVSVYGWSIAIGTGGSPGDFKLGELASNIGNAFLDREHGFLTRTPHVWLALLAVLPGSKRGRKTRGYLMAAGGAYALLYGVTTLRPGASAPGRYLVAGAPAYCALAALGLLREGPRYPLRVAAYCAALLASALIFWTAIDSDSFRLPEWYLAWFPQRY